MNCGYAKRDKGPDLLRGTGRNLIRERWACQWSAGVETALVEHAVWGSTMAEASAQLLRRRMAEAARAVDGARLLVQGFLMGLGDMADAMAHRLEELLLTDGEFSSLCGACAAISALDGWQEQYGERGGYNYPALLRQCFARILQMLPSMSAVDDRGVEAIQESCQLLYEITACPTFADLRAVFLGTLEELIAQDPSTQPSTARPWAFSTAARRKRKLWRCKRPPGISGALMTKNGGPQPSSRASSAPPGTCCWWTVFSWRPSTRCCVNWRTRSLSPCCPSCALPSATSRPLKLTAWDAKRRPSTGRSG